MVEAVRYFRPRNWPKFQSRSNNSMSWVKNYVELLDKPEYLRLTPNQRSVLHGIWLLCGRTQRPLEWDCGFIGRALALRSQTVAKALPVLKDKEFIELCGATSLEEKREEEKRVDPPVVPPRGKEYSAEFLEFWARHPRQRRGNKQNAWRAWKQALTRASIGEITAGHIDYLASDEVRDGFAKGAAAWLNDDRWKSDYRTFRKKTAEEQLKDWVDGDEGNDFGNDPIDGDFVEVSEPGSSGDGENLPFCLEGFVGQGGGNGRAGTLRPLGEILSSQAGGYHSNGDGVATSSTQKTEQLATAGVDRTNTGGKGQGS